MAITLFWPVWIIWSPHGQNGRYFVDDIFICIFVNEKLCSLIKIQLSFVPKGPFNNNPVFGLENGLAPNGCKPLSEQMLTLYAHAYMRH